MKNAKILLTISFLALLCLMPAVLAKTFSIDATLLNQNPDPVEPNEYVDLRFKIENLGEGVADNVTVEIVPQYPFALNPGDDAAINIGRLWGFQSGDEGVVVKYKLRVDADALEGDNTIKIRFKNEDGPWFEKEFSVSVERIDTTLAIIKVLNDPEMFEPGKDGNIDITVKNMGDSVMSDISLKLDLAFATLTTSQATLLTAGSSSGLTDLELPFAPKDSATEKRINSLKPGQAYTFRYTLTTYPDATSKIYRIPIVMSYKDENDDEFSKTDMVGVKVGKTPSLLITLDTTDIEESGRSGEVTIKIVNKDVTDVKFVSVVLSPTDDYILRSSKEIYVGKIDSDDYETADFKIYVKPKAKKVVLPITIEYKDSNNNEYTQTSDIEVRLFSKDELKQMSNNNSNGLLGAGIIAIVVVIGFMIYRNRRKKH